MKALSKCLGLLVTSLALASCGGGGGSGSHSAFEPTTSGSFTINNVSTQLPVNLTGVGPYMGSPYMSEVAVTWRRPNGDLQLGQKVSVAIAPVEVAAFSTLDNPATDIVFNDDGSYKKGNEFLDILGSGPVDASNGVATIFVHAGARPGVATLTISGKAPDSNETITKTITFTVTASTPPLPATIGLDASPRNVYVQGSGGNNISSIVVQVVDGTGNNVPDPVSGNTAFNNVQLEVVGTAGSGTLTANAAAGGAQTAATVKTRTIRGAAGATYTAGNVQGPMQIRVTADAADNNVDNGITSPVVKTTSVVVSDGRLYSLELTSPNFNAIRENVTSDVIHIPTDPNTLPDDDEIPNPRGAYSLTISVVATDRQGAPVLPGTAIRFGLIDEPVGAFNAGTFANQFIHSGTDGNPLEGGNIFTSLSADFIRANGNGLGPGDALLLLGKSVDGNSDLESAVTVQAVNSDTSLTVTPVFNLNNTTGVSVNNGPVLPYLAGRAQHANITAAAVTNSLGMASTTLNYPVSYLGHIAAIWAQGDGIDPLTNNSKRVSDVGTLVYPGIAPGVLTANPNPIYGNTTQDVHVCLADYRLAPITGVRVGFKVNVSSGSGSVDGNGPNGTLDDVTGLDGCVIAHVTTTGLAGSINGGNSGNVQFTVGSSTATVNIIVNLAALQANPGFFTLPCTGSWSKAVAVVARDQLGNPTPNQPIEVTCTNATPNPSNGVTDANGTFITTLTGTWTAGTSVTGSCTFKATGTTSTAIINFAGTSGVSPPPLACP